MTSTGPPSISRDVAVRILSLKQNQETDSAFAARVGLTPQLVNNYRAGRHGASLDAVAMVAERTDVSLRWLLTGEGLRRSSPGDGDEAVQKLLAEVYARMDGLFADLMSEYGLHRTPPPSDGVPARRGMEAGTRPAGSPAATRPRGDGAGGGG